jgi:CO/xanthine dehydrogenase Mo-binding subunit
MPRLEAQNWRNDAVAKVTGRSKFADDLKVANLLHAVPAYSDYVHARIVRIDTTEAEKLPGVVRVLTARDIPGSNRVGQIEKDFRIFADDKIRYDGDVVALVVAESAEVAEKGAGLVRVEASVLPAVLDPEEALNDTILVHEDHGTNIVATHRVRRGDIEAGFKSADFVVEQEFRTQFVEHAYLEQEVALCAPQPGGIMEVRGSMQHPYSTRKFVAACLGTPLESVEIIGTPLGGGFGGKDDTAAIVCARAALAARLLGRPVKTVYRREWSIKESYKRHPYRMRYRMGVGKDGRITAVQCRILADAGAYCSVTPWVTWRSTVQCCGPYEVANVHCDVLGVYTNNVVTGAMRGFGSPQVNFAIEQLVEMAAERAGLSPVEFRRRNCVRQGSVTITGQKLDNHKVAMGEVLDAVLRKSGYERKLARASRGVSDSDELYGIGLAMSYRGVGLGAEGLDHCAAEVNVLPDGSVLLDVGVHENGQGLESAMSILCAKELGVNLRRIRYKLASTSAIPDSGTTVASRGTIVGGGAVILAARDLKTKIASAVAPKLGCSPASVRFSEDRVHGRRKDNGMPFDEAIREMAGSNELPRGVGVFNAPNVSWNEETGQGDAYFTWVYGCQAVELTVNKKSGRVKLLRAYAAHDLGKAVNPGMVRGQFYGGMAMGIGYALHEEVRAKEGKIVTTNFNTYRIPRAPDVPEMTAVIVENPDPSSLSGAKSIGEPTTEIMAPAIANAIYSATGQRRFTLPIRLSKP